MPQVTQSNTSQTSEPRQEAATVPVKLPPNPTREQEIHALKVALGIGPEDNSRDLRWLRETFDRRQADFFANRQRTANEAGIEYVEQVLGAKAYKPFIPNGTPPEDAARIRAAAVGVYIYQERKFEDGKFKDSDLKIAFRRHPTSGVWEWKDERFSGNSFESLPPQPKAPLKAYSEETNAKSLEKLAAEKRFNAIVSPLFMMDQNPSKLTGTSIRQAPTEEVRDQLMRHVGTTYITQVFGGIEHTSNPGEFRVDLPYTAVANSGHQPTVAASFRLSPDSKQWEWKHLNPQGATTWLKLSEPIRTAPTPAEQKLPGLEARQKATKRLNSMALFLDQLNDAYQSRP